MVYFKMKKVFRTLFSTEFFIIVWAVLITVFVQVKKVVQYFRE